MNSVRYIISPFFILLLSILLGCAAQVQNLGKVQYTIPEFNDSLLAEDGIALLPIIAGGGQEILRRPIARKLETYFAKVLPEDKLLVVNATMNSITDAGLTEDYSKLIENHNKTGLLNKDVLQELRQVFGARYILYTNLLEQSRKHTLKFYNVTGTIIEPIYGEKGSVHIFGQIWDCVSGNIIWESIGQVSVQSGMFEYVKETTDELVDDAVRSVLEGLPIFQELIAEERKEKIAQARKRRFSRFGIIMLGILFLGIMGAITGS
jgi:hypothetical protein